MIERRIKVGHSKSSWLLKDFAKNITSQNGEDGIINKIFDVMSENNPSQNKWCVEFGAWDGHHLSNTWSLINNYGWSSVQIEGDAKKFQQLAARYQTNLAVHCICSLVDFEGPSSLDSLLATTPIPKFFDMLCIDIDGADYHIWKSMELFEPKLVVIEFNPTIPNNIVFIQERKMAVHQGSSLMAMVELGKEKGYELICCTLFNAFFVRSEYFSLFNIDDNSVQALHVPSMVTDFYQLYDGTLMISGCKKLLWHRIPINHEAIQILPASKRYFPFAPPRDDDVKRANSMIKTLLKDKAVSVADKLEGVAQVLKLAKELIASPATEDDGVKILYLAAQVLEDVAGLTFSNDSLLQQVLDILEEKAHLEQCKNNQKATIKWLKRVLFFCSKERSHGFDETKRKALIIKTQLRLVQSYLTRRAFEKASFWLRSTYALDFTLGALNFAELEKTNLKLMKLCSGIEPYFTSQASVFWSKMFPSKMESIATNNVATAHQQLKLKTLATREHTLSKYILPKGCRLCGKEMDVSDIELHSKLSKFTWLVVILSSVSCISSVFLLTTL